MALLREITAGEVDSGLVARQNLDDCKVRAAFAGAVTRRHTSPGEYLPVNAPVLMMVRQHSRRVRSEIPERMAAKIRIGQPIDVRVQGLSTGPTGRVVRLSPAIDAQSRSLVVEGEIPNQNGALRPGSFADVVTIAGTGYLQAVNNSRVYVRLDDIEDACSPSLACSGNLARQAIRGVPRNLLAT